MTGRADVLDRNTDVAVSPIPAPPGQPVTGLDLALPERLRAVDGVLAAECSVRSAAGVVGRDGRPVPGYGVVAALPRHPELRVSRAGPRWRARAGSPSRRA